MHVLTANNAWGELQSGITATDDTLLLTAAQGGRFPAPVAGTSWFYATIYDSSNNMEIVKCTARTGGTLTVVRGQDGTTALAFSAGAKVGMRINSAILSALVDSTEMAAADAEITSAIISACSA